MAIIRGGSFAVADGELRSRQLNPNKPTLSWLASHEPIGAMPIPAALHTFACQGKVVVINSNPAAIFLSVPQSALAMAINQSISRVMISVDGVNWL